MMNTQTPMVLIVDDDPMLTELFSDILGEYYDIKLASTVLEAQQQCMSHTISLIVSDYHLGVQTSDVFFTWLLDKQPHLAQKFILLTGDELSDLACFEGQATIIYKPVAIDALLDAVSTMLEIKL